MSQVLQKLQFAVSALGQHGCAERLHDLLDSNSLVCELILCRTDCVVREQHFAVQWNAYQTRPNAPIPTGCKSVYLR